MFNTALALRRTGKNVYVVVKDVMMVGTQYEDLYREVRRAGVTILRVPRDGDVMNYVVLDHDTAVIRDVELGGDVTIHVDSVVLSTPMRPNSDEVSKVLRLSKDQEGFLMEAHPKLGPVDTMTPGIFIAGAVRAHRGGFGEAVLEGYAAAARALTLLTRDYIIKEVSVPRVDPSKCVGCLLCIKACPYGAIKGEPGKPVKIDPAACQGCGSCVGECPYGALDMDLLSDDAIMAQIEAALAEEPERKVIMFTCAYCSYYAADNTGILKLQYPPHVRIIRLQCSSRLSWKHVKRAFELGAAGVFVTGCRLGDCHYITANYNTVRRFENWKKRLKNIGVREERFQLRLFGAPDVKDFIEAANEAKRIVETVTKEEIEQTKQRIKQLR